MDEEGIDAGEVAEEAVSGALDQFSDTFDAAFEALPAIGTAILILIAYWIVSRLVGRFVAWIATRRDRSHLGTVLGGLVSMAIFGIGVLIAATAVFPSIEPVDALGALGIGSVAIGFAFKDILQNWLAGLLILWRQPFRIGDWIETAGEIGEVDDIETRATMLRTFDGRRVVIPNATVYGDKVVVWTHYPTRRGEFDVGIAYDEDIDEARGIILETVRGIEGVLAEPTPVVMEWGLDPSWVTLRIQWWTAARDWAEPRRRVVRGIKLALDEAGIEMPFETQVHLVKERGTDEDDAGVSSPSGDGARRGKIAGARRRPDTGADGKGGAADSEVVGG